MAKPLSLPSGTLRVVEDVASAFAQSDVEAFAARSTEPGGIDRRLVDVLMGATVSGGEKRDALASLLGGEDVPAAGVRAGEILWLVDPPAAGDASR